MRAIRGKTRSGRHDEAARDCVFCGYFVRLFPIRYELCAPGRAWRYKHWWLHGPTRLCKLRSQWRSLAVALGPNLFVGRNAGFLRVRVPQNTSVSMPETTGYLTPDGQSPIDFELRLVKPRENRFARQTLARQDVFEHTFEFSALPSIAFSGTLTLPTVYLDGVAVVSPSFKFDRRSYAGVAPLNC